MGWREIFGDPDKERLTEAEVRIAQLERQVEFLLERQGLTVADVPGPDLGEAQRLMADGHKVDAIKAYRAATGAGLAEAKAAVETFA